MMNGPFTINPVLVAIAIAYRNANMIADLVLPRLAPMGKEEFKYMRYSLSDGFTIPDTEVSRRGRVNEVSFSAEEITESTKDYGLEDPIPQSDIDNADERYDPLNHSTEQLKNLIDLDREVRVSNLVFNPDTYGNSNKLTLAGSDQFSDASSDALGILEDSLNSPVMRPNALTFGQGSWSALRRHPQIVKAVHGNSGDSGLASREAVAELLEVAHIFVGQARVNSARRGQPANLQRAWGNHVAALYLDEMADNRNGTTFGFTAQFGQPVAGSWEDKNIGLKGGQRLRVGESVKEVIAAPDLGFFIENAA